MKVGILGSGQVAQALGNGFLQHGHDVMLGTRTPAKLEAWQREHSKGRLGSFAEAATFGELLVLAVKGSAAAAALREAGSGVAGKPVIDSTNPLVDAPPVNGVLKFFTTLEDSLMERLQREFPAARLVKAFNSVGNPLMVNPRLEGGPPTMFICGNDAQAKQVVRGILDQFGWETEDSAPWKPPARSNPCVSSGASPVFCRTSGCTPSSCCDRSLTPNPTAQPDA